jgi:hypothetical protein
LRKEFSLSAEQADNEPNDEALIHFHIWKLSADREEKEQKLAERKATHQNKPI